jgi:hypothetical protein
MKQHDTWASAEGNERQIGKSTLESEASIWRKWHLNLQVSRLFRKIRLVPIFLKDGFAVVHRLDNNNDLKNIFW